MDYHKKIKELRIAKGLNQKELAKLIFVTPPIICYIEKQRRDLTVGQLKRIADALGVNITAFFEEDSI